MGRAAVALPGGGPGFAAPPLWPAAAAREGPVSSPATRPGGVSGLAGPPGGVRLGRGQQPGAVHQPLVVVPVDPGGGDLLHVAARAERAVAERRPVPGALGFVESDGGFGQGVVVGLTG